MPIAGDVTVLWYVLIGLLGILSFRECLQLGVAPRRYFFSFENVLEVVLIGLTAALLFYGPIECHVAVKRQVWHFTSSCFCLLFFGGGGNFLEFFFLQTFWHTVNVFTCGSNVKMLKTKKLRENEENSAKTLRKRMILLDRNFFVQQMENFHFRSCVLIYPPWLQCLKTMIRKVFSLFICKYWRICWCWSK